MNHGKFYDGQNIKFIVFGEEIIRVGVNEVKEIKVSMENGQMAPVPWFVVEYLDGRVQKWNAALVEGVTLD